MTDNLTAALAKVQAELPEIRKSETAEVKTKTGGTYKYSYADLAAVSKAILPLLGKHGLAWVTRPTLRDDGSLVLAYELRHVSDEKITGEYPLSKGTPQEIGSAITYARRYCLCSVTGVAPESDDDDAAAASHRPQQDEWEAAKPPSDDQAAAYEEVSRRIADAATADEIAAIGKDAMAAKRAGRITPAQYGRLDRQAAAKLAEMGVPS